MQCENGYVKPGVKGILCRKCEEPKEGDLRSVAHALCGHQRFCPNQKCYTMLPGWENCTKREKGTTPQSAPQAALTAPLSGEPSDGREEGAGEEKAARKTKRTAKKKSAEAGAENAQKGEEA